MILFKEDWDYYPHAIADVNTKNRSFVKIAMTYKLMGVENHAFPLALLQPELQGVDPHAEDLTALQKDMISKECKENIWYVVREVIRLDVDKVPFIASRGNIAVLWAFYNHITVINIMPRQHGKSVSTDCNTIALLCLIGSGTNIQLITKDHDLRKKNIRKLKEIKDHLPEYLNFTTKHDADNQNEMTCAALGNTLITAVPRSDAVGANKVGRGQTSEVLLIDEPPFCKNIHITLPAAKGSTLAARDKAAARHGPYGTILTTTAGEKDTLEGKFIYDMVVGGYRWNELIYDRVNRKDAIKFMSDNSAGETIVANCTFSHLQLGRTNAWLKEAMLDAGGDPKGLLRDYLNIWTAGNDSHPLPGNILEIMSRSGKDPLYSYVTPDGYLTRWYIPESELAARMASGKFVFGLDSSNVSGNDANGAVMTDLETMKPIMTCEVKEASLLRYGEWLGALMVKYDSITLIVENKSSGMAIMDIVAEALIAAGISPYSRMYSRTVQEGTKNAAAWSRVQSDLSNPTSFNYIQDKGSMGFMTGAKLRRLLYGDVLLTASESTGHILQDFTLIEQINQLTYINNRVDHQAGKHDDLVIAWLLCHWFAMFVVNARVYGLEPYKIKSLVLDKGAMHSPAKAQELSDQKDIRDQANKMEDDIGQIDDPILRAALTLKLKHLTRQLKSTEDKTTILDRARTKSNMRKENHRPALMDMLRGRGVFGK